MYSPNDIKTAYKRVQKKYDFAYDLKDEQVQILVHLVNKHNVLGVLPTGFGKSDIFVLLPLLLDELQKDSHHCCLVVVPLIALIDDLVERFRKRKVGIICLQDLKAGEKFSVILVTPESLEVSITRKKIESCNIARTACCVAVDEAHVLPQWYFTLFFNRLLKINENLMFM